MFSKSYYLLRSNIDGRYLVAQPLTEAGESVGSFLLLFQADYEALSYLSTHAESVTSHFVLEPVSGTQLTQVMDRWSFRGVGLVKDPLTPQIEFMIRDR
ncbi:MAG: hypothetical protein HC886_16225 [Leptolyngbyaceae cyanobacterium SM1_1_3]|nr:hypothetical protein [Leptolyngbyaceae cyanobacterium SM1_1_3]NJN01441.1 hypothetical protein [Leptolyngbyaceae cyanobacterium RM1_1_2]